MPEYYKMEPLWPIVGIILGIGAGLARIVILSEDVQGFTLHLGTLSGLTVALLSIFQIFCGNKGNPSAINLIIGTSASFFIMESIVKPFVENTFKGME